MIVCRIFPPSLSVCSTAFNCFDVVNYSRNTCSLSQRQFHYSSLSCLCSVEPFASIHRQFAPHGLRCKTLAQSVSSSTSQSGTSDASMLTAQIFVSRLQENGNTRVGLECFLRIPLEHNGLPDQSRKMLYSRFRMARNPTENVSVFLSRLVSSMDACITAGYTGKKNKQVPLPPELQVVRASLLVDNATKQLEPVPDSWALKDALYPVTSDQEEGGITRRQLCLHLAVDLPPLEVNLQMNPARIYRLRLTTIPIVGCPLAPVIQADNLCLEKSIFEWFVGKSDSDPARIASKACHTGFVFYPRPEDAQQYIWLRVSARNRRGELGLPFGDANAFSEFGQLIRCEQPVLPRPLQTFHQERAQMIECIQPEPRRLRVVSYNLLAEVYARLDSAKQVIFRQCPLVCLDLAYRLPLLLRELVSYRADLLCLQEVDSHVFHDHLVPVLRAELGMSGLFLAKQLIGEEEESKTGEYVVSLPYGKKDEGCALFYRADRLELVERGGLPSMLAYASTVPRLARLLAQWRSAVAVVGDDLAFPQFPTNRERDYRKAHAHCLLTGLFRLRESTTNTTPPSTVDRPLLLVGTTHFYFHPNAHGLRQVQAAATLHHLTELASRASSQSGRVGPIVFLAGDINQAPDGPAYETLVTRYELNGDNDHELSEDHDHQHPGPPASYSLELKSAFLPTDFEFTNWVPGFHGKIDVILYSPGTGLTCVQRFPLCSRQQIITEVRQDPNAPQAEPRGDPLSEEDQFALPNAHFPSDHLALLADFVWSPPHPVRVD